jgi:hypothetical protein
MKSSEFVKSGLQLRGRLSAVTDYKAELLRQIKEAGLPDPVPEFKFHPERKYRADWKIGERVLIEYQGGLYQAQATGHRSTSGVVRDIEKLNEAVSLGFVVIQVTPAMVTSRAALRYIKIAVEKETNGVTILAKSEAQIRKDAARALRSVVANLEKDVA